jgi:hypothetical protein
MRSRALLALLAAAGGVVALVVGLGSTAAAILAGGLVLATALLVLARRTPHDPSRRRVLGALAALGLATYAGGTALSVAVRRALRPDPGPEIEEMARVLGADVLELIRRTYHPERSGDLQLILTPGSSSNYPQESTSLLPNDPRTSHALPWMYLERVPIVVYAPGLVPPSDGVERVTLADLAPTIAHLAGFEGFEAADGAPLPRVPKPTTPPRVVVTFVIDGGGWNVLARWPDAWPNLKRLAAAGATFRNAIAGSSPAVTACAHATIGTGAFPRTHGITGHNIRDGSRARKAYGSPGDADPADILVPTLADRWVDETAGLAWVGEIGYQIWHLGMLGDGGRPLGRPPVAVYYDEDRTGTLRPQHPERYRMPDAVPPIDLIERYASELPDPTVDQEYERFAPGLRGVCCDPPVIRYQGDLIEATFDAEGLGARDTTDLLFVNYKAPDYAGHVFNMLSTRTRDALAAVDEQLGRLAGDLERRFGSGGFALIVTADHGQCPNVDATAEGVRLDPIQLQEDLVAEFGTSVFGLVQSVVPSEVYLSERALRDAGLTGPDIAAWLRGYTYGDNVGPYVRPAAVRRERLGVRPFAAVLPTDFLDTLVGADLSTFGPGAYGAEDPGIPPVTW